MASFNSANTDLTTLECTISVTYDGTAHAGSYLNIGVNGSDNSQKYNSVKMVAGQNVYTTTIELELGVSYKPFGSLYKDGEYHEVWGPTQGPYYVVMLTEGPGIKSFTKSPNRYFKKGETVSLKATVEDGYHEPQLFYNGGSLIDDLPCSMTVNQNLDLYARAYVLVQYTVRAYKDSSGGIASVSPSSSTKVTSGKSITFEAELNEGYTFDGWYVYGTNTRKSTSLEYTFSPTQDISLEARAKIKDWYYRANKGSSSGIASVSPSSYKQITNFNTQTVNLSATLRDHYIFTGWEDEDENFMSYLNPVSSYPNPAVSGYFDYYAYVASCKLAINENRIEKTYFGYTLTGTIPSVYSYGIYVYDITAGKAVYDITGRTASQIKSADITGLTENHKYRINISYTYTYGSTSTTNWIIQGGKTAGITVTTSVTPTYTLTIEHRRQTIQGGAYELYDTDTKKNIEEGTSITLADYQDEYVGFTYSTASWAGAHVTSITITDDTTIVLFYNRNWYNITFKGEHVTSFTVESINRDPAVSITPGNALGFAYGDEIIITPIAEKGYEWKEWQTDVGEFVSPPGRILTINMPAFHVTLTAIMEKAAIPLEKWTWNSNEIKAFNNKGYTSVLTYERWNAFLTWSNSVIAYFEGTLISDNSFMTEQKRVLTASAFNNITSCIKTVAPNTISPDVYSRKSKGDIVYGWYFSHLAEVLNGLW